MNRVTIVGIGVLLSVPVTTGAESMEPWPQVENAFKGAAFVEVASWKGNPRPLRHPGWRCPEIPVGDYRGYSVTVRFDPSRTLKMEIDVGRLPSGFDAYGPLAEAAIAPTSEEFPEGCLLSKSGMALLQVEKYWFAFPTFCKDVYPYRMALPIVIRALKEFWKDRFPSKFFYAPCGTMSPVLVGIEEYLAGAERRPKHRRAAQQAVAADGRPQTAARR